MEQTTTAETFRAEVTTQIRRTDRGEITSAELFAHLEALLGRTPAELIDQAVDGGDALLVGEIVTLVDLRDRNRITDSEFFAQAEQASLR